MKQKILFISDHGDPLIPLGSKQAGGQNNYVKHLALQLDEQGYSIDVVTHWCDEDKPAVEQLGKNSKVYRIAGGHKGFIDKQKMYELLPAFYREMVETLDVSQYDVIHTHYWLSGILAKMLRKDYSFHWVHTNHSLAIAKERGTGLVEEKRKRYEWLILQEADAILATTENEKEQITRFIGSEIEIAVVPIGVAPIYLAASGQQKAPDVPYYFYAGRLEESKGIFDLIKAFRTMLKKYEIREDVKLLIAGGDAQLIDLEKHRPKDPKLLKAIKGLEHRIAFLGPKNEEQLKTLYANALVTIMPSHYESFGMVAAEAQACGCPVIATNVGGLKNIVKSGVTGFHFPKANAQKLSEQMVYFLEQPALSKSMRKAAKDFAKKEFNWALISRKVKGVYS